jgi:diguanylate cyclase (GGDEF)-like protein
MTSPDDPDRLLALAREAETSGRHAWGAQCAEAALAARVTGEALASLALHRLRLGELRGCFDAGLRGLRVAGGNGAPETLALLEGTLAVAALQAERVHEAQCRARECARWAAVCKDPSMKGWANLRLAQVHRVMGHVQEAEALFAKAWEQGLTHADTALQFSVLHNRTYPVMDALRQGKRPPEGELREALSLLERAQVLADGDGNVNSQGLSWLNRARALHGLGQTTAAAELALKAADLSRSNGLTQMMVGAEALVTEWRIDAGDAASSLRSLEQLRETLSEDDLIGHIEVARLVVRAHRQLRQFEQALDAQDRLHQLQVQQLQARADLQSWLSLHEQEVAQERSRAERAELNVQIERLRSAKWQAEAHHDVLTGLMNRRFFEIQQPELAHRAASGRPVQAVMVDVDHFKRINDRHGHAVGDRVLRELGGLLRAQVRPSDLPFRLGGEEFLVLLPDTDEAQVGPLCERLRSAVEAHDWAGVAAGLAVTVSLGVAPMAPGAEPLLDADAALYRAKASGRNRVVCHAPASAVGASRG